MLRRLLLLVCLLAPARARASERVEMLTRALAQIYGGELLVVRTGTATGAHMVSEFLHRKYGDRAAHYRFVADAEVVQVDAPVAGTLRVGGALAVVASGVEFIGALGAPDPVLTGRARGLVHRLASEPGVVFGFDGLAQSHCAAPTEYLLVLDTLARTAHGIELNPCWP
jgi:hypothetical protein